MRYRTSISSEDNHDKSQADLTRNIDRVVIIGSGQSGDIALRYLRMIPDLGYLPVGYIDDASLVGRKIYGIEVLGTVEELEGIVVKYNIDGLLFAEPQLMEEMNEDLLQSCRERGCWAKVMKLSFDTIE